MERFNLLAKAMFVFDMHINYTKGKSYSLLERDLTGRSKLLEKEYCLVHQKSIIRNKDLTQ